MNKSELSVTVIVENLDEIKELINETQDLVTKLKSNVAKLEESGLQFQVKANK